MKIDVPSIRLECANLILGAGLACAALIFAGLPLAAWNAAIVARGPLSRRSCFGSDEMATWTQVLIGHCVTTTAAVQLLASRQRAASDASSAVPK